MTDYFREHPEEINATLSPELHVERYRVVQACMASGVPLNCLNTLRPLIERGRVSLCDHSHMAMYVPKIETRDLLRSELRDRKLTLIYDGSSRLGECIVVIARWIDDNFVIQQRLICLRTRLLDERAGYVTAARTYSCLDADGEEEDFTESILKWWKDNQKKYPTWATAAKTVLAFNCNSAFCFTNKRG